MEHCCLQRGDLVELARVQRGRRQAASETGRLRMIKEERERVCFRPHKYNMNSIH